MQHHEMSATVREMSTTVGEIEYALRDLRDCHSQLCIDYF